MLRTLHLFIAIGLWSCAAFGLFGQTPGLDQRAAVGPFLNNSFPKKEQTSSTWQAVEAFPQLQFDDPTCFVPEPRTNRLYVGGRQGAIYFFENDPAATNKTLFLDLTAQTQGYDDCGLLGMAFHPEYGIGGSPNRGYVYVYYSFSVEPIVNPAVEAPGYNRLSRFTVPDGSLMADTNSELVLINQFDRHIWHNGGGMFFGPDGFLYLSNGDGGGINDPYDKAQEIDSGLFSGVLRIDVDMDPAKSHPIRRQPLSDVAPPAGWPGTYTQNYYIPNDNPWLDPDGSILEEFFAIGLRSPHRMTYDPPTGRIWLGDVGQGAQEEVNIIEKGGNYQWAYMEGGNPGPKARPGSLIGAEKLPIYDYGHNNGNNCVIGGYVYRATEHAAFLFGKYIFGDNGSSRVWAMTYDGSSAAPEITELCAVPTGGTQSTGISSFGLDQQGEIYICVMGEGVKIYKLARTGDQGTPPPALLSQTGAFTDLVSLVPNNSFIPYTVNSPLWSDHAVKFRWMAVPNDGAPYSEDETIGFFVNDSWSFPIGTVFVKHFELPVDETNPAIRKRLETRFLVRGTNGNYYGVTYKWRADNSDADLLPGGLNETNLINTAAGLREQVWSYPSRQDCLTCHNANAKQVLGLRTCQMNGDFTYPATGRSDNQLRTLNAIEMFTTPINESSIPSYPKSVAITDTSATLEHRVRSYLDANCSQCHRPDGARAFFDARLETPLSLQGIVNGAVANRMGISGAKVVAPQSLDQSLLYVRDNLIGQNQMPPLAKNAVDTNYIQVLAEWINSLPPAPAPTSIGNSSDGTFIDFVGNSWINAGQFQAAGDLRVTTMFAKVAGIAGRYKCAIYTDGGGEPDQLLGETAEIIGAQEGWNRFPLLAPVQLSGDVLYWLAIWSDDPGSRAYYSDRQGFLRWAFYDYGEWPDPLVTAASGNFSYCIYAVGAPPPELRISHLGGPSYRIELRGAPLSSYRIEFNDGLVPSQWQTLTNRTTSQLGAFDVVDAPGTNAPQRFYRAIDR